MRFDVLTLFPGMFAGPFDESIIGRAQRENRVQIHIWDIRDFTHDKHRTVDDTPYGGGPGMVLKPEPIVEAHEHILRTRDGGQRPRTILLAPQGRPLNQRLVEELANEEWLILVCGHYEGIDERVRQLIATDVISIGDFVLTGGEPAAMVIVDAVTRLLPGVLGGEQSADEESFSKDGLLEYPQYTRPLEYRGLRVPDILLSGHHEEIRRWRRKASLQITRKQRPDLLRRAALTPEDHQLLAELDGDSANEFVE